MNCTVKIEFPKWVQYFNSSNAAGASGARGAILRCSSYRVTGMLIMRASICLLALLAVMACFCLAAQSQGAPPVTMLPVAELQKLADSGDPAAQNELGVRYRLGDGVDKDPAKAIPLFLKAAKQGYTKAYFNLGAGYYNGDGVPISDKDACTWFLIGADAGESPAQDAVDRMRMEKPNQITECETLAASAYLTGDVVKQNLGLSAKWFTVAANANEPAACERLAYLYARGLGLAQDKQASLKWLKRSADLGYPVAMFELGRAYERGDLAVQDLSMACKLYQQAAQAGYSDAMLALADHYSTGRGVPLDSRKAYVYYYMAAMFGRDEAKPRMDAMAAELPQKQIVAAQQEAIKLVQRGGRPLLVVNKYK